MGLGSLRQAILDANGSLVLGNTIQFAIPGDGVHTINLFSSLPTISRPVLIDGYSQPGASANTLEVGDDAVLTVELNGASAGANANGLVVSVANTSVRGLVINRFGHAGIELSGAGATNDIVEGNFIGTNSLGTAALRNGQGGGTGGVLLINAAHGDIIGGESAAVRNLISGNNGEGVMLLKLDGADTHDNTVENNYIGTNASGTAALGNLSSGIFVPFSGGNKIEGNVVSGNTGFAGIALGGIQPGGGFFRLGGFTSSVGDGSSNVVTANLVGTDATGTAALGNFGYGISVDGGNQMTLGGTANGAGNIISGNLREGIHFFDNARTMLVLGNRIGTDLAGVAALGNQSDGISITGGANAVTVGGASGRNLISGNTGNGISIITGATGNLIQGNYVGIDVTGTSALGNHMNGVSLNASGNTIGGTTAAARNVLSGNLGDGVRVVAGSGSLVQGNYIGTDFTGTTAVANDLHGVEADAAAPNVTIGGTAAGAGNVISGNGNFGLLVAGSSNVVAGNFIGTNGTGTAALSNGQAGMRITGANNMIGGAEVGARNVISGQKLSALGNGAGIEIFGTGASGNVVQGNYLGTDVTGTQSVSNVRGVVVGAGGNLIGGTAAGTGNIISGNSTGIEISGGAGTRVEGNFIGTDLTGTVNLGNFLAGVMIDLVAQPGNVIGGTTAAAGNLISGNRDYGIWIMQVSGTIVEGNFIGTDISGTHALGNIVGIYSYRGSSLIGGTTTGAGNLISGNIGAGVYLDTIGVATTNMVQGNRIGTNAAGTAALGNLVGVYLASPNNTIGGTEVGAGNLISGNANSGITLANGSNLVQGNLIGTDASGTVAVPNQIGVSVTIGTSNTIGGTMHGAGNVISGNQQDGVAVAASGNIVQANYIGTDLTGMLALPNANGVSITAANVTVGGLGAGNLISGNHGAGVFVQATGAVIKGNLIGTDVTGTLPLNNNTGIDVDGAAATNALIGGTSSDSRNVISGGNGSGVLFLNGGTGVVEGNYIGTDIFGATALGNGAGVLIQNTSGVTIGGTADGAGNLISGNGNGILTVNATGNLIQDNLIGTDATGTQALGNLLGVVFSGGGSNTIGGSAAAARNVVSGNQDSGIDLAGSDGNLIRGNYIGTDVSGTLALGNQVGVTVAGNNNTIGGSDSGAGNVISGNTGDGIFIGGNSNLVQGNRIGTDVTGAFALGNGGNGVNVSAGANNTIGGTPPLAGNTIAFNSDDGVLLQSGVGNAIRANSIFANAGLGIRLLDGANNNQPAPVLTSASSFGGFFSFQGTLTAVPSTTFTIEIFANTVADPSGFGQGERLVAFFTVTTDASGHASFAAGFPSDVQPGELLTATATDPAGNTSVFSQDVMVTA
jgi:parallel beta-helix repeat protein